MASANINFNELQHDEVEDVRNSDSYFFPVVAPPPTYNERDMALESLIPDCDRDIVENEYATFFSLCAGLF